MDTLEQILIPPLVYSHMGVGADSGIRCSFRYVFLAGVYICKGCHCPWYWRDPCAHHIGHFWRQAMIKTPYDDVGSPCDAFGTPEHEVRFSQWKPHVGALGSPLN